MSVRGQKQDFEYVRIVTVGVNGSATRVVFPKVGVKPVLIIFTSGKVKANFRVFKTWFICKGQIKKRCKICTNS